ncbi:uncharacterized protein L969DRAFT_94877 [Mixia osmundae IAM 14324]|uniref:Transcription initiation factor TFIID subunit 2 n=1 Tax=Mixia osmundae (strain CBS 9802 / IAM 14324 / JCM 22182 / KY 12970) TaxID=764103 RepID=G7E226_MIXOS|nr:uncharacterized protein L969DRAFT_94877 [Mixia osmundae IAM 14324]KEI38679.1 hypothetical protein L969DRAFT_94877 [Mixia osmundae IAM 14324]GAA96863.1 hypothetical protein E5Q_03536 [Mixia osmundae IAM 14324]
MERVTVLHQRITLDVDLLNARAACQTELTVIPSSADLATVYLNSRGCRIQHISLSRPQAGPDEDAATTKLDRAEFELSDPFENKADNPTFQPTDPNNFRTAYPELKRKLYSATHTAQQGELAIAIPPDFVRPVQARDPSVFNGSDSRSRGVSPAVLAASAGFEEITISISYTISSPRDGLHFVRPDSTGSNVPHVYTTSSSPESARYWVPCVDTLWDRSTFELEIVLPRSLGLSDDDGFTDVAGRRRLASTAKRIENMAIGSGDLVESVAHPAQSSKKICLFRQLNPVSIHQMGFAAGPFESLALTAALAGLAPAGSGDDDERGPQLRAFALVGAHDQLPATTGFLQKAMRFYEKEYGSYPFNTFNLVFVDDSTFSVFNTATLAILSSDHLHADNMIEPAYDTRQALSHSLAYQWFGINIIPKAWSDVWLTAGLALYMVSQLTKHLLGNNEYRFRLKKDIQRCCRRDIRMPPLCQPNVPHPPDNESAAFYALKAPLVLTILDRHLRRSGNSLGLSRVIPKLLISVMAGELKDNTIGTPGFLRMCRKLANAGVDLRPWANQWIYGSGCPHFNVVINFNRKKMIIEVDITQHLPAANDAATQPWSATAHTNPVQSFDGALTIRIHEFDGTPYDHVLGVKAGYKRHEVAYNTRFKRIRSGIRSFIPRQHDANDDPGMGIKASESRFHLQLWEDAAQRTRWKVADYTEEEVEAIANTPYEWIRIDADMDWICSVAYVQPEYAWIAQLERDKDVIAQLDAVHGLLARPSLMAASSLAKTLLVETYFFRIRIEAIYAMLGCATDALQQRGLFYLLRLFYQFFDTGKTPFPADHNEYVCVPSPNDFSNVPDYLIKKAFISAVSLVRDASGLSPHVAKIMLIDLLAYNDNSRNAFDDSFMISEVISDLAVALLADKTDTSDANFVPTPADTALVQRASDEVERYQSLDRLVPSYQNLVTVAALNFKFRLMAACCVPLNLQTFVAASREGNHLAVRIAALDCLIFFRALQDLTLASYVFSILVGDASFAVRRYVAQSLLQCMPTLALLDDLSDSSNRDTGTPDKMHRAVRKEIGRTTFVRESILTVLLRPDLDLQIRWILLKLCEVIAKPAEEALPRIKFKMPGTAASTANAMVRPRLRMSGDGAALGGQPLRFVLNTPSVEVATVQRHRAAPKLRGQKSGMSFDDLKACQNCLKKILVHRSADLFRNPVDPVKDVAPRYFEIVKDPMDLSTMSYKLEQGYYASKNEFKADFELMIHNCHLYNSADSRPVQLANSLKAAFDKQWERILATLAALQKAQPAPRADIRLSAPSAQANGGGLTLKIKSQPSITPEPGRLVITKPSLKVTATAPHRNGATTARIVDHRIPSPRVEYSMARAKAVMRSLIENEKSVFFRRPVDPILDGCPTYYDEIKDPMDLGTMMIKVREGRYRDTHEITRDFTLIGKNCRIFNPPGTLPIQHAEELERAWPLEWLDVDRIMPGEKRSLQSMLKAVSALDTASLFREAVDPVALGIPTYFEIIPREDARDLSLIRRKLEADLYRSVGDLDADVRLMIFNCLKFNAPVPPVVAMAKDFERDYGKQIVATKVSLGIAAGKAGKRASNATVKGPAKKAKFV